MQTWSRKTSQAGKRSSHMVFIQSLKANTPPPSGVYVGAVTGAAAADQ